MCPAASCSAARFYMRRWNFAASERRAIRGLPSCGSRSLGLLGCLRSCEGSESAAWKSEPWWLRDHTVSTGEEASESTRYAIEDITAAWRRAAASWTVMVLRHERTGGGQQDAKEAIGTAMG